MPLSGPTGLLPHLPWTFAAGLMTAVVFSTADAKPVNIIFDPPGSIQTVPQAINASNWVVGTYYDGNAKPHGFLRMPDGTIATVEPPGATSSNAWSITDAGMIAGEYKNATGDHIFTQSSDGTFASYDIAGAKAISNVVVNPSGMLAGTYQDNTNHFDGFVRAVDGTLTKISLNSNTGVAAINADGTVAGSLSNNFGGAAYTRTADGVVTTFEVNGGQTFASDINRAGSTTGSFWDTQDQGRNKGYVRAADGTVKTFELADSAVLYSEGINDKGWAVGFYEPTSRKYQGGFLFKPKAPLKLVRIHGYKYTSFMRINASGAIVGTAATKNPSMIHGLLRTP